MKRVSIFGYTGSIGESTLNVIRENENLLSKERYTLKFDGLNTELIKIDNKIQNIIMKGS